MKNFFLLLSIIIFSCSSSDDGLQNSNSINPPSWIQGTWYADDIGGFRFTNNNFCQILGSSTVVGIETCYKELLELGAGNVEQESTNGFYSIKITISTGVSNQTYFHQFEKISNTKMKWYLSKEDDLYTIYTKQ